MLSENGKRSIKDNVHGDNNDSHLTKTTINRNEWSYLHVRDTGSHHRHCYIVIPIATLTMTMMMMTPVVRRRGTVATDAGQYARFKCFPRVPLPTWSQKRLNPLTTTFSGCKRFRLGKHNKFMAQSNILSLVT